jgi:acyl-CoA reductase-like NAD-dependent aldehyde dehydrogenase
VFGPVASIVRVKPVTTPRCSMANDTAFRPVRRHRHHVAEVRRRTSSATRQAGMVMVNLPTAGVDYHVPFGGRKGSSYGSREQGRYAQEFYTVVKTSYIGS